MAGSGRTLEMTTSVEPRSPIRPACALVSHFLMIFTRAFDDALWPTRLTLAPQEAVSCSTSRPVVQTSPATVSLKLPCSCASRLPASQWTIWFTSKTWQVPNDIGGIERLVERLSALQPVQVILEAARLCVRNRVHPASCSPGDRGGQPAHSARLYPRAACPPAERGRYI